MKKQFFAAFAALVLAACPGAVVAQVEKQVEVTKAYVPSLESASKLAIEPDMTDTTRMRPEIDYTITPLSIATSFETRPIRPATVTYWEFNRPLPFYLKVGAGYPLNSVLDFYVSSQNPGTGYVVGYVNHEGRYAKIRNDFGRKNNSVRMTDRLGVAAGKYLGQHMLEGDLNYDNRLYHRYGAYMESTASSEASDAAGSFLRPGAMVDFGDANVALRFGDDFQNLARTNFEVALHGGLFFDHSYGVDYRNKARQSAFGASAKVARGFGRHRLSLEMGYERLSGQKAIDAYRQQTVHAAARYGHSGGLVELEAGADYFHDKVRGAQRKENYIVPFVRLDFDLGTPGLHPFLEFDGGVSDNGYRSLTRQNPYVANPAWLSKSSVDYNGRVGIGGSLWNDRFDYRAYASFSVHDNHVFWYGTTYLSYPNPLPEVPETDKEDYRPSCYFSGVLQPLQARQTVTSFHGEAVWRPIGALRIDAGLHGYIYNDDGVWFEQRRVSLGNGEPAFRADVGLRYEGRKIAFGVKSLFESPRKWTSIVEERMQDVPETVERRFELFTAPFAVDLRVDFEWRVARRIALFAEGRNLLNRKLYEYPWYRESGAMFTVGVRANFR